MALVVCICAQWIDSTDYADPRRPGTHPRTLADGFKSDTQLTLVEPDHSQVIYKFFQENGLESLS